MPQETEAAAGTTYLTATLELAPGAEPCSVDGYPGVIVLTNGVPAGVATTPDDNLGSPQELTVLPDRTVRVTLSWAVSHYCGPTVNDAIRLLVGPGLDVEIRGFGATSCSPGEGRPAVRFGPFTYVDPRAELGTVTPYSRPGEGFAWRVCGSRGGYCRERRAGGSLPCAAAMFDTPLATQLAGMPRGRVRQGQAIGHAAAAAVLKWRQNDGWPATQAAVTTPDPTYVLPPFPGLWQPTPPANSFATFTFYRERQAVRDVDEHAASATSAADAHERPLRRRLQRGQAAWIREQRGAHGR